MTYFFIQYYIYEAIKNDIFIYRLSSALAHEHLITKGNINTDLKAYLSFLYSVNL